jgi:hypothetical protein
MFYKILASIVGLIALAGIWYGIVKAIEFFSGVSIKKSDVCPLEKEIKKRKVGRKMFCPKLGKTIVINSNRCMERCGFA